ncbi:hypothetical protein ACFFRR_000466 [Megaselia abdita]
MIKKVEKQIEINFSSQVLTRECVGQMFIAIYELLLFQRNCIPFVYKTFKFCVSRLPEIDDEEQGNIHFETHRQISVAKKTLEDIKNHFELILNTFKTKEVREMRVLFGSTPLTPKEVWVLKCPKISKNHSNENHRSSADSLVKNVLMQIIISTDLCDYFASKPLPQTNVFLEFDMTTLVDDDFNIFTEKDSEERILQCNNITLDLIREEETNQPNCCLDLEISEGVGKIFLEKTEKLESTFSTYEVNDFIKGYKDKLVKGKTIWEICGKK